MFNIVLRYEAKLTRGLSSTKLGKNWNAIMGKL